MLQSHVRADGLTSSTVHRYWNSYGRRKVSVLTPAVLALIAAALLAACGGTARTGTGSAGAARTLLTQTFSESHPINRGRLNATVTLDPTGSSLIVTPVTLSFGGPFQSRGAGRAPASDFSVGISFDGQTGQVGIISTGTAGYLTLEGSAYKLPAAEFQQLESGVSAVGGGGSASTGSTLSALGIHPEDWLTDPEVVGSARVGGVSTEHIHGNLALGPLLTDLSKLLGTASAVSSATASLGSISPAEQGTLRREIRGASFDLWTGTADHTIAKLSVTATLPVSGRLRTELAGLSSAKITFALGYSDVGQTQTIATPTSSKPFPQFETKLKDAVLAIEQALASADTGSSAAGSGAASTTSGTAGLAAAGGDAAYSACVSQAAGDVAKLQKCAALLNRG